MLDKPSQKFFARLQPRELLEKAGSQVVGICWREVGAASVLRVAPDALIRIEFRRVRGKLSGYDSPVLAKEVADDASSLVDVASVPDDRHRPTQVTAEKSKKLDDVFGSHVLVVWHQFEVQPEPLSYGAQGDRTDRRDPVSAIPASLDRRLAAWSVRPSHERRKHEA